MDTDRVDTGRSRLRSLVVVLLAGLVLGGVLGALVASLRAPSYQATTAVTVLPDSVALNDVDNGSDPTLDPTAYIQGQLIAINGEQVVGKVRSQLKLSADPDITANQVGQTYVVQITATAGTRRRAVSVARAAAQVYDSQRVTTLASSLAKQVSVTTTRQTAVQNQLTKLQGAKSSNASSTPTEIALQNELQQLQTQSTTLQLEQTRVTSVVTVEAPAHSVATGASSTEIGAGVGAIVGAIVGLLALASYRRISPRAATVGDVAELGLPVLLPVLPRTRTRSAAALGRLREVRLIAARLSGDESTRVLVTVGAAHGVGASRTAASLAAAVASRGPVLLVQAGGTGRADHDARDTGTTIDVPSVTPSGLANVWLLPGADDLVGAGSSDYPARSAALVDAVDRAVAAGWYVIVDAPPLSESDLALDCLRVSGSAAVLVVGRGISRPADILSAAELLETRGDAFAGAVLNDIPRLTWRRSSKHLLGTDAAADRKVADEPIGPVGGSDESAEPTEPTEPTGTESSLDRAHGDPVDQPAPGTPWTSSPGLDLDEAAHDGVAARLR